MPCILGLLFCAASVSAQDSRAFYISFEVPGSLQTSPAAINNFSTVTGTYTDAKGTHGFLREAFGRITSFDVPRGTGTSPAAINDDGMIVGNYVDSSNVTHGFLRRPNGTFARIDAAGSTGTRLTGINVFGAIVGYSFTSNGSECFVRSPQGTITVFEPMNECQAKGINLFGAITGFTGPVIPPGPPVFPPPPQILIVGFVRSPAGVITHFNAPGSSSNGTYALFIDAFGGLAGFFQNARDESQNFLESPQGTFTTITPPGATVTGAEIMGLSELGAVTGFYDLPNGGGQHGFVQNVNGVLTSFDFPGAGPTTPTGINNFGVIIGTSGAFGILRVPY
ncbi:MAG: hypothetical protein WA510_09005 [Acidobacteriaceae bacterium]